MGGARAQVREGASSAEREFERALNQRRNDATRAARSGRLRIART